VVVGGQWVAVASGAVEIYLRLVLCGAAGFLAVCGAPILAKWTLIGRWKPGRIPLWSLAYVRFWIVKTLIRSNPCALLFLGSPLTTLYLRALGAKVGPGVVIFSRRLPVCTDLLTIGAGTVIRKEAIFLGYRARAGFIETGTVTLGQGVFVGERSVLDIDVSMGDGAELGHASSLHAGQAVPDGERWHGSPAQRTDVDYRRVPPLPCSALRRFRFGAVTLFCLLLLYLPLAEGGLYLVGSVAPSLGLLLDPGAAASAALTWRDLVVDAAQISAFAFFGGLLFGLLLVGTVPRLLRPLVAPGKVYPLYGLHDRVHRLITFLTNSKMLVRLFGDSSYVVRYLSSAGYRLSPVEQTGSNFGIDVKHENPFLCSVGTGTMVADGLILVNDEVSSSSFRTMPASIGPHSFVGNDVTYPAGGRTGDDCLLATKAMIPLDGEIRTGVGLLGSPSFEIPRSVERDLRYRRSGDELRRGVAAKNRHNLGTIAIFCFTWWLGTFLFTAVDLAALEWSGASANWVMPALFAGNVLVGALYFALVERSVGGFRRLEPTHCSIYDPSFWRHERLWKVTPVEVLHAFDGTPLKSLFWRLMGVRIGRRVFDDGAHISERTLTTIGDDCALNAYSKIMCHSQEDAGFKSDRTVIGAGCTVGVGAFVHYGVTMGDGSSLAPDSFLMKGEEVPPHAHWGGNPAREM
jgi:non-ribosomal peptide synthetase-like protein